jgi:hypothetical protein
VHHLGSSNAGWSKELLDSLFDAIADLRKELRLLGSDLVVLTGRTADVLTPLALKVLKQVLILIFLSNFLHYAH